MNMGWAEENQRYGAACLRRVLAFLGAGTSAAVDGLDQELRELAAAMERPPAIVTLREAFGLSGFEQDLLMLCAGLELDDSVRSALAEGRGGDAHHGAPTFGLALATIPGGHWSALTPASPLRRWRLVEVAPGPLLTETPLSVSERVLHYLAGVHYIDETTGLRPIETVPELPGGQAAIAREAAACIAGAERGRLPALQFAARRREAGHGVAAATAAALGLKAALLRPDEIPSAGADRQALARRIEREAVLAGLLPALDCTGAEAEALRSAGRLADEIAGPVILLATHPIELLRSDVRFAIPLATPGERHAAWRGALGPGNEHLESDTRRVAEFFDLDSEAIRATAGEYAARSTGQQGEGGPLLWELARGRARPRLDHLTERVEASATWDQLVLPDAQAQLVREIAVHARWRGRVYREWAFGGRGAAGLGISALFSGPSGTGKSMTAEVIAGELGLDLYRIDLSRVVSKYIGETEKNLGSVFDEAEGASVILLFDEADALFGKRSEVKDSHDRYANLEVSYLLQRMEAYDGLAILTTNQRSALDPAFLRRIRFAVQFPFPDAPARAEVWRRIFPPEAPTESLDFERLSRLNLAGGNIRNMALNAAFHAAAAGTPIGMNHILLAARAEYAKLERPLPEAEVRGWT